MGNDDRVKIARVKLA